MNCDMLTSPNVLCYAEATHVVPGTPLGPVAMCNHHFAGWLADNDGNESNVIYLNGEVFIASFFRERARSEETQ